MRHVGAKTNFQQDFALSSGQQARYRSYRSSIVKYNGRIVYDDRVEKVARAYSKDPARIDEVKNYLNEIVDGKGRHFARSYKDYREMVEVLQLFKEKEKDSFRWNEHFKAAFATVSARYPRGKLVALKFNSSEDILEAFQDTNTSAGIVSILEGVSRKCDYPVEKLYSSWVEKTKVALETGSYGYPCTAGYRSQGSGEYTEDGKETGSWKAKTRLIWIVCLWNVISEVMFAHPLIEWLKGYPYTAIAKSDSVIAQSVANSRARCPFWVSLDYSKYDSSIPSWLIDSAFTIVGQAFNLSESEQRLLEVLKHDYIHTSILMDSGVEEVDHGTPSGSGFTSIINGICNEIMTETWAHKLKVDLGDYMIMGDDNLIFSYQKVDLASIEAYIKVNFGVTLNAEKSKSGTRLDNPEFLSRFWTFDGPYRDPHILVSKMLYPERFRPYGPKGTSPELVFYSYILGYRAGMEKWFDVRRFLQDYNLEDLKYTMSRAAWKNLPYNVRLEWEFNPKRRRREAGLDATGRSDF